MSIAIPTLIEKDIRCGKARYQTYQTGIGGQSVLIVPDNSYIIIFGYDYSPAGGGFFINGFTQGTNYQQYNPFAANISPFETQQISFYTGQAFHPFIHHVDIQTAVHAERWNASNPNNVDVTQVNTIHTIDSTPQSRSVYIISSKSVAITVGMIERFDKNATSTIPVTDKTPPNYTYGGSTATPVVESVFSPNIANPPSFVQPSLKQFQDYGLGGVPGNAQDQAFALPDQTDGLIEISQFLQDNLPNGIPQKTGANYFLNVRYALYTEQTPEALG